MKTMLLFSIFISMVCFTSCSPAFMGGGFLIPLVVGLGGLYSWYRWIKTGYRIPFVVAIILTAAFIVIWAVMQADL